MIDRLLSLVAPHICCSCGENNGILCEYCFYDIKDNGYEQCVVCLRPCALSNLCRACHGASHMDDAWVVGERSRALKKLIDLYKFERATEAARVLARLLAARLPQLPADTIVCYIPDIPAHRRQRGYDHMALIAKHVARQRGWQVRDLLVRQTSLPQRGVGRAERLKRQRGAFRVEAAVDAPVVLIDDIYTTGATLTAGVDAIRAISDHPVYVGVIARQPKNGKRKSK